ncbi:MAG: hypothetical protein B7733_02555 [Myxococcales bacterium FL481]|nr:MAG: hypothetical protein B7733_02555 [Myxococcales bacterium FL481]
MVRSRWRTALPRVAAFFGLLAVLTWPRPDWRAAFAEAFSRAANVVLAEQIIGRAGRVELGKLPPTAKTATSASDTALHLTADGFSGRKTLGVSVRRDVYLPACTIAVLILVSPLSVRRKLVSGTLGVLVIAAIAVLSYFAVAAWTFANVPQPIFRPGALTKASLELLVYAGVAPPGNRFIVAFVLGCALIWRPLRPRAAKPSPPD